MPYSSQTHRSVSTWFPIDLLSRLDQHLAARCSLPGQRASRQDWILAALKNALDAATSVEGAALAVFRARAALEAAASAAPAPAATVPAAPGAEVAAPGLAAVEAMRSAEAADLEEVY